MDIYDDLNRFRKKANQEHVDFKNMRSFTQQAKKGHYETFKQLDGRHAQSDNTLANRLNDTEAPQGRPISAEHTKRTTHHADSTNSVSIIDAVSKMAASKGLVSVRSLLPEEPNAGSLKTDAEDNQSLTPPLPRATVCL
jgi:hypothetical protein